MENLTDNQRFKQFMSINDGSDMIQLALDTEPAALDMLEQQAEQALAQTQAPGQIRMIQERLDLLRKIRAEGPEFLALHLPQAVETALHLVEAYADVVAQWVLTEDWDASQAYLEEHGAELLTDEAESLLILLQQGNPDDETIDLHIQLLAACRQQGIEAAYGADRYAE